MARSRQVRQILDAVWPKLSPEQVLFRLLSDPGYLAAAADGQFSAAERARLVWDRPYRSAKSARWSAADAVLLDELAGLIDRAPSLSHVMVDEAQDLSPMQCRALGRRCVNGSLTVLGDIAQATSAWAVDDWPSLLTHLDKPDIRLAVLDRGFRVPAQIIDYAARLLPAIAPGLAAPASLRRSAGARCGRRRPPRPPACCDHHSAGSVARKGQETRPGRPPSIRCGNGGRSFASAIAAAHRWYRG